MNIELFDILNDESEVVTDRYLIEIYVLVVEREIVVSYYDVVLNDDCVSRVLIANVDMQINRYDLFDKSTKK